MIKGWENDISPNKGMSYTDSIIYELHVRDLSINEESGIKDEWKGKFLGLTQKGTTNNDGDCTGLDYIKDLGVNYVHIMPMYDYGSVDEAKLDTPQFNWGYDPVNYNVPEGSYKLRISEIVGSKKADQPLPIHGNWECEFVH